jgi:hypothetical protein
MAAVPWFLCGYGFGWRSGRLHCGTFWAHEHGGAEEGWSSTDDWAPLGRFRGASTGSNCSSDTMFSEAVRDKWLPVTAAPLLPLGGRPSQPSHPEDAAVPSNGSKSPWRWSHWFRCRRRVIDKAAVDDTPQAQRRELAQSVREVRRSPVVREVRQYGGCVYIIHDAVLRQW